MYIPPRLRPEIARAILDDEGRLDGEHLFDGEQVIFYCPMQAPDGRGRPAGIAVRDLLPREVRIPTFGDYLVSTWPRLRLTALSPAQRLPLQQSYEEQTAAWLITVLAGALTV